MGFFGYPFVDNIKNPICFKTCRETIVLSVNFCATRFVRSHVFLKILENLGKSWKNQEILVHFLSFYHFSKNHVEGIKYFNTFLFQIWKIFIKYTIKLKLPCCRVFCVFHNQIGKTKVKIGVFLVIHPMDNQKTPTFANFHFFSKYFSALFLVM